MFNFISSDNFIDFINCQKIMKLLFQLHYEPTCDHIQSCESAAIIHYCDATVYNLLSKWIYRHNNVLRKHNPHIMTSMCFCVCSRLSYDPDVWLWGYNQQLVLSALIMKQTHSLQVLRNHKNDMICVERGNYIQKGKSKVCHSDPSPPLLPAVSQLM